MNVGVLGLGYWGPNIVRNLLALGQNVYVHDPDPSRVRAVMERSGDCHPVGSVTEMLEGPAVPAVVLAVPLSLHCPLIVRALESGKHVFVEKPMCATLAEADAIRQRLNGSVFMVGHITRYNNAIAKISQYVRGGELGDITRIASTRSHLGPVYKDTDVLTEVAAHDIAIVQDLLHRPPASVRAWGTHRLGRSAFDSAHLVLTWSSGCLVQIDVQWSSVIRRRELEVEGTQGTMVYRAHTVPEQVIHYDHRAAYAMLTEGTTPAAATAAVRESVLETGGCEPLREELAAFLECIEQHTPPATGFEFSRGVVSILEAARESMHNAGATIRIS